MMGDNRDDSEDSRVLDKVGYVPIENLVGRAEFILISLDLFSDVKLWEVWRWPEAIRWERSVSSIQ